MHLRNSFVTRGLWVLVGLLAVGILVGCDEEGNLTEAVDPNPPPGNTLGGRNISAVVTQRPNRNLLQPVERIPREQFGQVPAGQFVDGNGQPTALAARALFFPSINAEELAALAEGIDFFTTEHTAAEGLGPVNNQTRCLGCHLSSREITPDIAAGTELLTLDTQFSRAARATPTNFTVTARGLDDDFTTGGRAADHLDALNDTGDTAAFTIFGNFSPSSGDFFPLEAFGGAVQHTRPSLAACVPDSIIPVHIDPQLSGGIDPFTGLSPIGIRRTAGERAGPPYVGRGLMEALHPADIVANEDPNDADSSRSSLATDAFPACVGDCISGRHNENNLQLQVGGDPVVRLSRFGLRGAGPTIIQFVTGGAFGELGFTIPFQPTEPNNPVNVQNPGCLDQIGDPDLHESVIFGCRNFIRMSAPPELGAELLTVLEGLLDDPRTRFPRDTVEGMVQRGGELFGVNLAQFAACIVAGTGNCLQSRARARDRQLDCAGCHTPVFATGGSPAEVGDRHLSQKWIHLFSDLLLHDMGEVTPERVATTPRDPLPGARLEREVPLASGETVLRTWPEPTSFDLSRNLADDTLPAQGRATGREWRTPPLWGMGKTSPPFLHDARVYLSGLSVHTTPASTVYTDRTVTNAPLIIQTQDDAIRAAIELHDLPAPDRDPTDPNADDRHAPTDWANGGGCPIPAGAIAGAGGFPVFYMLTPPAPPEPTLVLCPPYAHPNSLRNRSEAREVILRYRSLSPRDQQALIEFLKQL